MKLVAWGLCVVSVIALALVWMIGMQKQNSATVNARTAESNLQQAMNASISSHEYEMSRARGKQKSLANTNLGYEEDIATADERIAEAQAKVDEVGDTSNIQGRADLIAQIAQLRRDNEQLRKHLNGGN